MRLSPHIVWLLVLVLPTGCERKQRQFEAEAQTIFSLIKMVESYQIDHLDVRITNFGQVFAGLGKEYPHVWHAQFQAFGTHAGFTNSFFEKYVFLPTGITNRRIEGEILFMNARPYPGPDREMKRTLVAKEIDGFVRQSFSENTIQKILSESGVIEPKPMPMPPPPAPPDRPPMPVSAKVSRFFMRVADFVGLSGHWLTLRNATFLTSLAAMLVMGGFLWASRSRR